MKYIMDNGLLCETTLSAWFETRRAVFTIVCMKKPPLTPEICEESFPSSNTGF
jgi:hypothetical protein